MARTIVDVTQLAHWQGKITGIPRVMDELAVRFQRDDPDAVFAVWVKEIREFCEIDFAQLRTQRGHGIPYMYEGQATPTSATAVSKRATTTTAPARPSASATLQRQARRVVKASINRSRRVTPRLADALEARAKAVHMARFKRIRFQKDDCLFIPWGEWWDMNFIDKLEEWHKQNGVRLVQIVHDMGPAIMPHLSNSGNATQTFPVYCRRILPLCDLVLTVSENSKREAVAWLKERKLHVPPIHFFRLGDDIQIAKPMPSQDPAYKKSGLKGKDFILLVGTFELKKNHLLLYYVYHLALERGIELPKMVMVGRRGWLTEVTYELMSKDPLVKDKFVFLFDTSDEELSWIYDRALFSVLPSMYEGWGIPIAESIARGVPCLAGNTSSMPEVAPGFVKHFSSYSTDELLDAMHYWLKNPKELAKARKHTQTYKQFTWDESFAQVAKQMRSL
jgi:glycosyltransferase involved in cell wall biosynthesis